MICTSWASTLKDPPLPAPNVAVLPVPHLALASISFNRQIPASPVEFGSAEAAKPLETDHQRFTNQLHILGINAQRTRLARTKCTSTICAPPSSRKVLALILTSPPCPFASGCTD
jgi:hypothetical protein